MTTIACDGKVMAGDSLVTEGCSGKSKATKIYKINEDRVGFAGGLQDGLLFIEWYKDRSKDKPDLDDDFGALVLQSNGKMVEYENKLIPIEIHEKIASIGSGAPYAITAMHLGESPQEAVKIAAKFDKDTGLPVKVL